MFGNLALNPSEDIERHNNFRTFVNGLTLLFRQVRGSEVFGGIYLPSGEVRHWALFGVYWEVFGGVLGGVCNGLPCFKV